MVLFHALGGVTVTDGGRELNIGGPRQRRLLAVLLVHRNSVVSVDRLTDAVFAGDPTPGAATTMRSYVARMRRVIEVNGSVPAVITQAPGYLLRLPDEAFDVARFEAGLAEGRRLLSRGEPDEAATALRTALGLWRGDAYAEFADEDWALPEAQRLEEERLVGHELLFEAELAAGRAASATGEIDAMVGRHPLREAFVAQLMTALYRSGRQADALRAFDRHREQLVDELGLDPSPALRELQSQILDHDPDLREAPEAGDRTRRGYRLGERLGTGHDGALHAARLPGVDRELVIREYRADIADDPAFVRTFEATAHRLASLHHPAIVPIHDYWREPGAAYLVTRRMHGGSLADRLDRRDLGPLSTADALALVRRVGSALTAAATAGVAHGRVDVRSVLLDESGEAWLTDFALGAASSNTSDDVAGLARLVGDIVPHPPAPVVDAIARGLAADPPPIEDYVATLLSSLAATAPSPTSAAVNPYKGLRAFDETDAGDFFGRDGVVADLAERLGHDDLRGRLVLVVGGSGTGKSSVVRAGLLPCVRRGEVPGAEEWFVTSMVPGAAPFKELASALRRVAVVETPALADDLAAAGGIDSVIRRLLPGADDLLLVVDQLEELFTSSTEADQRAFLDGIFHAVTVPGSRLRVVGTLRADFYDRPLAFHPFGAVVSDATVTLPAMSAAELEAAITEPARRAGRPVDGALVAELVGEALDQPAALPALQFALFELAERSDGPLTLGAYHGLGGLSGAIASRAEDLYQGLDDDERGAVRRLFGQLVVVNPDGEPTRRRATRTDATGGEPALEALVDRWADARLLTLDRHRHTRLPTVEPAHEALLREWPRLRRWIDEDRDALLVLAQLRDTTATWIELDRDPGSLFRGARLQVALDHLDDAPLGPQEREFLDASEAARAEEERSAADALALQARANRRLRAQLALIGVALVIALVGGLVALDQRGEAEDERAVAFGQSLAAAADASLEEDPERSLLLALEAVENTRDGDAAMPEAIGSLHEAISRHHLVRSIPGIGGDLDWSPDGSVFVTEGPEESGMVDLRDPSTGESVRSWRAEDIDINDVAFDADGRRMATTGDSEALRVWDVVGGEEVASFTAPGPTWAPSFSADGSRVAAAWLGPEYAVRIFDLRTEEVVAEIRHPATMSTDFSPDGRTLVFGSVEASGLLVVDAADGRELLRFGTEHGTSRSARYSPDGRWIASSHDDGTIRVWDAVTGEQRSVNTAHRGSANVVDWNRDGTRLASGGNDGTAKVFEVDGASLRDVVVSLSSLGTSNGVGGVAFSPDGERLVTGDWAVSSTRIWDVSRSTRAELTDMRSAVFRFTAGSILPDGRSMFLIDEDGTVVRRALETGEAMSRRSLPDELGLPVLVAPSPDGEMVATTTDSGSVVLSEVDSGRTVADIPSPYAGWVPDLEWSHDGQHLAIVRFRDADEIGVLEIRERGGRLVAEMEESPGFVMSGAAFTARPGHIAVAVSTWRQAPGLVGLRVWDWREERAVRSIETLALGVAADPTSNRIAFLRELTDTAEIWDLDRGERVRVIRGAASAYGVAWSPDGEHLALSGADGTIRVFGSDDGRLELTLRGHQRAVHTAAFGPGSTRLASLDEGGTVRIWSLDLDELVRIAESRLTRDLVDAECRQYLRRDRCDET